MVLGAAMALSIPGAAFARDRDHDRGRRYSNNGYYGMSAHERHEYEERVRKQQREAEKARRRAERNGYNNNGYYDRGYYGAPSNGYYDRYGRWHQTAPSGYYDAYGRWRPYSR